MPPTVDVRRAEAKYILPLTALVGPRFTIRGLIDTARRSGACNPIFGRRSDLLPFKFQIKSRFRSRLMVYGLLPYIFFKFRQILAVRYGAAFA